MVSDLKIGFKVGVAYLLKESREARFDFFSQVKEVEFIAILLGQYTVHQLLELLGASCDWHFKHSK